MKTLTFISFFPSLWGVWTSLAWAARALEPVGRSADKLTIHVNGKLVAVIDEAVMRQLMQPQIMVMKLEIADALNGMRRPS